MACPFPPALDQDPRIDTMPHVTPYQGGWLSTPTRWERISGQVPSLRRPLSTSDRRVGIPLWLITGAVMSITIGLSWVIDLSQPAHIIATIAFLVWLPLWLITGRNYWRRLPAVEPLDRRPGPVVFHFTDGSDSGLIPVRYVGYCAPAGGDRDGHYLWEVTGFSMPDGKVIDHVRYGKEQRPGDSLHFPPDLVWA
jgi:hypothetical protein